MAKKNAQPRLVPTAIFLAVLAAAGGYLGVRVAQRQQPPAAVAVPTPQRSVPAFLQASVAQLPRVQLLQPGEPAPVTSSEVLPSEGGVVLFLDMQCDPCKFLAGRWQDHIREGRIEAERVVGITPSPQDAIEPFRESLGLWFPIYADPLQAYVDQHGVDTFPWEVVVGEDGTILGFTGDLDAMGKLESLAPGEGS